MSDSVSMSLDDYIKSNKKLRRVNNNRGRGGSKSGVRQGGGGGRGRNNVAFNSGGRNNASFNTGRAPAALGNRNNQSSFRGRKRQAPNNVQRRRGGNRGRGIQTQIYYRGGGGSNSFRGNAVQFRGQGQTRGQRLGLKSRQGKRQRNANANIFNQVLSQPQQGSSKQFYSGNAAFSPKNIRQNSSNQPKRVPLRPLMKVKLTGVSMNQLMVARNIRARTKSALKLAKKRVQRAAVVTRKTTNRGLGPATKLVTNSGRVALGNNGFVTVRNSKSKQMEKALVKLKIARAHAARNKLSSPQRQRQVNIAGSSSGIARFVTRAQPSRSPNWNTPIVRTMRNELADEMGNGQLNPEIQRKIAFIQNRSTRERAPVMADFKAPVTTSRMKLSDRFRLLRDQ